MVTGRISLRSPEYSPISSSVSDVRAISSRFHCRPATVLVTRISVVALASAIAAAPTSVFPAPQGRTTTPEPPPQRLPGPPGEDDGPRAPGPEALDGLLLVVA